MTASNYWCTAVIWVRPILSFYRLIQRINMRVAYNNRATIIRINTISCTYSVRSLKGSVVNSWVLKFYQYSSRHARMSLACADKMSWSNGKINDRGFAKTLDAYRRADQHNFIMISKNDIFNDDIHQFSTCGRHVYETVVTSLHMQIFNLNARCPISNGDTVSA